MRTWAGEVGEQRIQQVIRVAVLIEPGGDGPLFWSPHQLRRRVVVLEVDDHPGAPFACRGSGHGL